MSSSAGGPCDHCGRTNSPCWRKGPPEKPLLCNACGARYLVKRNLDGYFPGQKVTAPSKSKRGPSKPKKPSSVSNVSAYSSMAFKRAGKRPGDGLYGTGSRSVSLCASAGYGLHFDSALQAALAANNKGSSAGLLQGVNSAHLFAYGGVDVTGLSAEEFNNIAVSTLALLRADSDDSSLDSQVPPRGPQIFVNRRRRKPLHPQACY